ncbi:MAG: hypothetical protein Kow0069_37210 [Promethearchaeota archaeon]
MKMNASDDEARRARAVRLDMKRLNQAHGLEEFAIRRYQQQQKLTSDAEVHSMLEGIIRNEVDHQRMIEECARALDPDAEVVPVEFVPAEYVPPEEVPPGTCYAKTLDFLLYDLFFEDGAQEVYSRHAKGAKFPETRQLFVDLKRAEFGHSNELKLLIRDLKQGKKTVQFFCPVCGFTLTFGTSPGVGKQRRCPMCGALVELACDDDEWSIVRRE